LGGECGLYVLRLVEPENRPVLCRLDTGSPKPSTFLPPPAVCVIFALSFPRVALSLDRALVRLGASSHDFGDISKMNPTPSGVKCRTTPAFLHAYSFTC
jgi:hypothetical protein